MESVTKFLFCTSRCDSVNVYISTAILSQLMVMFVMYFDQIMFNRRRSMSSRALCIEILMVFSIGLLTSNMSVLFGTGEVIGTVKVAWLGLFVFYGLLTVFAMYVEGWSYVRMDRTFHCNIATMLLIGVIETLFYFCTAWMKMQAHDEMELEVY